MRRAQLSHEGLGFLGGRARNKRVHRLIRLPGFAFKKREKLRREGVLAVCFPHNFMRDEAISTHTQAGPPDASLDPGPEQASFPVLKRLPVRIEVTTQGGVVVQFSVGEGIPCFRVVREKNKLPGNGVCVSETFLCEKREKKLAWQVVRTVVKNKNVVCPACVDALPGLLPGPDADPRRGSNIVEISASD